MNIKIENIQCGIKSVLVSVHDVEPYMTISHLIRVFWNKMKEYMNDSEYWDSIDISLIDFCDSNFYLYDKTKTVEYYGLKDNDKIVVLNPFDN